MYCNIISIVSLSQSDLFAQSHFYGNQNQLLLEVITRSFELYIPVVHGVKILNTNLEEWRINDFKY